MRGGRESAERWEEGELGRTCGHGAGAVEIQTFRDSTLSGTGCWSNDRFPQTLVCVEEQWYLFFLRYFLAVGTSV